MKIGLTLTENPEKHQYYINWLKANEDIEVVSLSAAEHPDDLQNFDALVLSGGLDIHPEFYGGDLEYPKSEKWKKERDLFEQSLLSSALDQSIPILGICRGLQLINVAFNGTLIQDSGDELNDIHEGNPDKSHTVTIEPGTVLHDIARIEKAAVNSAHHQAIDKLADGLKISARSDEGIIEAVEWKDPSGKPFLLAVQWHPERMFRLKLENSPLSKTLRESFISAIKKSKAHKNADH